MMKSPEETPDKLLLRFLYVSKTLSQNWQERSPTNARKIPNKPTCLKIFVFLSFQLPRVLPETAGAVECKIRTVSVQLQKARAILIKNIILRTAVGQ